MFVYVCVCVTVCVCVCQRAGGGRAEFIHRPRRHWSALIGHFEVVFLFFSPSLSPSLPLSVCILCAARCSVQNWMNDLEQARRAVLPWQPSLAQPVTAGCNSTPWILAGVATLIKRLSTSPPPPSPPHSVCPPPNPPPPPSPTTIFSHTSTCATTKESHRCTETICLKLTHKLI